MLLLGSLLGELFSLDKKDSRLDCRPSPWGLTFLDNNSFSLCWMLLHFCSRYLFSRNSYSFWVEGDLPMDWPFPGLYWSWWYFIWRIGTLLSGSWPFPFSPEVSFPPSETDAFWRRADISFPASSSLGCIYRQVVTPSLLTSEDFKAAIRAGEDYLDTIGRTCWLEVDVEIFMVECCNFCLLLELNGGQLMEGGADLEIGGSLR